MKTVFTILPLVDRARRKGPYHYKSDENKNFDYDGKVFFPINAVLAKTLKKDEKVQLIILMDGSENSMAYAKDFEEELSNINMNIGAEILPSKYITNQFVETKGAHEKRLRELLNVLTPNMEIIADITFGQKTQSWVLQSVFKFAEKFYDADVKAIIYGKLDYNTQPKEGESKEDAIERSAEIFDVTSLYYLTSLTSKIEGSSAEEALRVVDAFFAN